MFLDYLIKDNIMFKRSRWQDPLLRVVIDSRPPKCERNMGMRPITKFLSKFGLHWQYFSCFERGDSIS